MDDWLDRIPVRLYYLEAFVLRDVELDFSGDSLDRVEQAVLARWDTEAELYADDKADWIIEGVVAYVGETMLRLAGGGWRGPATIQADLALELAPLSPLSLLTATVSTRATGSFRQAYAAWEKAASERLQWTPTKEPTPGLDPVVPEEAEVEFLENWLATRAQAFPCWVEEFGSGIDWDFSPDSLDSLAGLVLQRTPTVEAYEDRSNAAFVDGASWYLGETLRRVRDGSWNYRDGDPDVNLFEGHPFVEQPGRGGSSGVPFRALRVMVKRGDAGQLCGSTGRLHGRCTPRMRSHSWRTRQRR